MLDKHNVIPTHVVREAHQYFDASLIQKASLHLHQARVAISFTNGRNPESFFVVSGIVNDNKQYETKVSYKKRFEGTPQGAISSHCTCNEWSESRHCSHSIALFLYFKLSQMGSELFQNSQDEQTPPIALNASFGVTPTQYGTIVQSPNHLEGSFAHSSYSSMQYLLSSRKVIHFPLPKNIENEKIAIFIDSPQVNNQTVIVNELLDGIDEERQIEFYAQIKFGLIGQEDRLIKRISLFESLYIFNWDSGETFHLNDELKDFIKKIRVRRYSLNVNTLLELTRGPVRKYLRVYIQGKPLNEISKFTPHPRIHLTPLKNKKGQLQVECLFHTQGETEEDQKLLPQPEILTAFSFNEGKLGVFRKKNDAYEFIEKIQNFYQYEDTSYKTLLLGSFEKKEWLTILETLFEDRETLVYDALTKTIAEYDNSHIKKLIFSFIRHFGPMFFRFSSYNKHERRLTFNVSSNILFEGLSAFYQEMSLYGIEVFYDRAQMATWQSRVRFERRSHTTKWFDLELSLSEKDYEIIKKGNEKTGVALTKQGLVLLNSEQKELLRFMKKYTQYEALENEKESDTEFSEDDKKEKSFVLPFNRSRIFELFELKKLGVDGALNEEELQLCERLINLEEIPQYDLPSELGPIMRPYQTVGYNWLRFLYENRLGACLADDMGLGKTLQTIAFLSSIYNEIENVLIVCPVSILLNWENEFKKFSHIEVEIYHGGDRKLEKNKKIILTSYGVMKKEAHDLFSKIDFDIFILDEVQHLKNIRSLGAFAARTIKADFRICLTGTPVENDLAEFYNILDLSIPGVWGDIQFIRTSSTKKSRLVARKTASPFILRRTKTQVLTDLPPKIENNTILEMNDIERETYIKNLQAIKNQIEGTTSKRKYGEILRGLLKLRQLCLWQNIGPNSTNQLKNIRSTKIHFLIEMLEQLLEEGHQAIIFSQFTTYLDIIQQFITEKHWKFSRIDGAQSIKKRHQQVELFQAKKNPLFLISLKAGGVGLNLTAASYVFIMDPWWNPAVEQQAIDRAHRIGQENPLNVYRPIIKNSVEEKVLSLQEMKKQLFEDLLPENEDNLFTGKLSMKDFEHLFSTT